MPNCDRDWIKEEYLSIFHSRHQYLWNTMIRTDTNIHILEEIERFEIGRFLSGERLVFWRSVVNNTGDVTIIKLSSLLNEAGKDGLSLRKFRNQIRCWIHEHRKAEFNELGRKASFDGRIRVLEEKITEIRNKLAAHLLWDYEQERPRDNPRICTRDLRDLFEAIRKLWDSSTPFSGYATVYCSYGSIGGRQKDIRNILIESAKQNQLFLMPEHHPGVWQKRRERMSPEDISEYNMLRKRLYLPPVI